MTRPAPMLGRVQVPGCCPGARAGRPGPDCTGGHPAGTRAAKRAEQRITAAEITRELSGYQTERTGRSRPQPQAEPEMEATL